MANTRKYQQRCDELKGNLVYQNMKNSMGTYRKNISDILNDHDEVHGIKWDWVEVKRALGLKLGTW